MEIKEFVRSLTTDQLQGLIRFSKHRLRGGITGAIEDHLEGNSEDFEFVFGDPADGNSKAKQTHPGTNPPKAATGNVGHEDLIVDPSQNLIVSDRHAFEQSRAAHIEYTEVLNKIMAQFSNITGESIREEDFCMFLCLDNRRILNAFLRRVPKKKLYDFNKFLFDTHKPTYYLNENPLFDLRRIRFVDGKAVFNEDDAFALLAEEFSIDLNDEKVKALMLEFQKLSRQYEKFRKFLEENIQLYGVNPSTEPLIGQHGAIIELDPTKSLKMELNPHRLSALSSKTKKNNY